MVYKAVLLKKQKNDDYTILLFGNRDMKTPLSTLVGF